MSYLRQSKDVRRGCDKLAECEGHRICRWESIKMALSIATSALNNNNAQIEIVFRVDPQRRKVLERGV